MHKGTLIWAAGVAQILALPGKQVSQAQRVIRESVLTLSQDSLRGDRTTTHVSPILVGLKAAMSCVRLIVRLSVRFFRGFFQIR